MSHTHKNTLLIAGKILSTRGTEGALRVLLPNLKSSKVLRFSHFFIRQNETQMLPYFIRKISRCAPHEDIYLCLFDEINTREEAKKISGQMLYVEEKKLTQARKNTDFSQLIQYTILDAQGKRIGTVKDVQHNAQGSALLQVQRSDLDSVKDHKNSSVLLPIHEHLILDHRPEERILQLHIAEGLLEL